jgi:hypothetical protein
MSTRLNQSRYLLEATAKEPPGLQLSFQADLPGGALGCLYSGFAKGDIFCDSDRRLPAGRPLIVWQF